ncbi:MAG: TRAP transporter small permease [Oscillospiraceae bacterium]|nr:TRAP transporter small permease [Oscillospiraceae bacterium]
MERFSGGLQKFCKIVAFIGAIFMLIMILATVVDVFCRKVIMSTYPGATEIVSFLLTAVVYCGVGYCAMGRGMITIDIFKPGKVLTVANNILCVLAGSAIVYATTAQAVISKSVGGSSLRLQIPKWPFMLITAFGFLIMCVILILQTIEDLKKTGTDKSKAASGPASGEGEGGS